MVRTASLLVIAWALASCNGDKRLSPKEYLQFIEQPESKLRQVVKDEGVEYSIQLAPSAYMACKELIDQDGDKADSLIVERQKELKGYTFFLINISQESQKTIIESLEDKSDVGRMTSYYQFEGQRDITLSIDSTIHSPAIYHFEDNYGISPYNTIVAGFKTPEEWSTMQLSFNDRYRDNPLIHATYDQHTVKNLPILKTTD